MKRFHRLTLSFAFSAFTFASALPLVASAQQLGEGMVRSGTVGIQNDTEKELFSSLICTCGCPREALSTCTCGFAHERRSELRAELAKGVPLDAIRADYVARYGTQALSVPPNEGARMLLWIAPVTAIALAGLGIIFFVRRVRRRTDDAAAHAPLAAAAAGSTQDSYRASAGAPVAHDAYDDKLEQELKRAEDE